MPSTEELFCSIPIFAGLKNVALDYLISKAEAREVAPGELVFREGVLGNDLFLLETGAVEIIRHMDEPREKRLAILKAPDFFGEMSILECQPRSATVRAAESCKLHVLLSTDLYHLFEKWPDQYAILILNVARDMARRLRRLDCEFSD